MGISYFVGLSVSNTVGSGAGSGARIFSGFFVGNILLLKLLRIFSLALRNNPAFFRKDLFSTGNLPLYWPVSFNALATWFPCLYLLGKK